MQVVSCCSCPKPVFANTCISSSFYLWFFSMMYARLLFVLAFLVLSPVYVPTCRPGLVFC